MGYLAADTPEDPEIGRPTLKMSLYGSTGKLLNLFL